MPHLFGVAFSFITDCYKLQVARDPWNLESVSLHESGLFYFLFQLLYGHIV
jgi:hypothetical protein